MEFEAALKLSLAVLILMLKPGPVMITCMSLAFEGRWRSILSFWFGYLFVRTFSYFFLLTTLTALPQGFGIIFLFVKAFASILFITLGLKGLQSSLAIDTQASEELKGKIAPNNYLHNFLMGGTLQLSNPYDYVFILAVIPALVGTTSFSFMDITYINLIVIFFDVIINAAYILPILYFRKKIFSPAILKKIRIGASCMLILIGIYIFISIFMQWGMTETQLLSDIKHALNA